MLIPSDHYSFSSFKRRPRRGLGAVGVTAIVVVALGLLAGAYALFFRANAPAASGATATPRDLGALWNARQYAAINGVAEKILQSRPMDTMALTYDGYAYFYQGVAQSSLEEKIPLFDRSIVCLRKALLTKTGPLAPGINYVLGKDYYEKGKYYVDLAIRYLDTSLAEGYVADDSYQYLGLAYSDLGEYDQAAGYFEKAIAQKPSDLLYFILAQTYYKGGNSAKAEEVLLRAIDQSEDSKDTAVEEQARFLLGRIYTDDQDYQKAEDQYRRVIDIDAGSADAHYFLGNLYELLNDKIRARAEWRAALRIDPSHDGARLKLYH